MTTEAAADADVSRGRCETADVGRREDRGLSLMLADALEHLVRGIVEHPDDVSVRDKQLRRGSILEVRVHPSDLGKVIGRGGRTATAFRTVISSLAGRGGARIDFVDVRPPALDRWSSLPDQGHLLPRGGWCHLS